MRYSSLHASAAFQSSSHIHNITLPAHLVLFSSFLFFFFACQQKHIDSHNHMDTAKHSDTTWCVICYWVKEVDWPKQECYYLPAKSTCSGISYENRKDVSGSFCQLKAAGEIRLKPSSHLPDWTVTRWNCKPAYLAEHDTCVWGISERETGMCRCVCVCWDYVLNTQNYTGVAAGLCKVSCWI